MRLRHPKRWLAALVFAGGFGLGLDWSGGTYEAQPANSDPVSEGDDRLRELKQQTRRRLQVEGHFGSASSNDNGLTREGSGRAFHDDAAPTTLTGAIGAFIPATEGNDANTLSTSTTAGAEITGEGRLWVDSNGGAATNTVTGTNNKLYIYDGANARWEEVTAKASNFEDSLGGAINLLRNGSFEDVADAGTGTPSGWALSGSPSAITHQDTDTSEGVGHEVSFAGLAAADEGILQALAGLKVGGSYYAVVRADDAAVSTCSMRTTGLAVNPTATTTTDAYETLSFTFTADVATASLILESDADAQTCTFDHAGVFERTADRIPTPGHFVQFAIDTTSVDTVTAAAAWETKGTLTVTVPGPGYALVVDGMASFLDVAATVLCTARISQNIDGGGATTAIAGVEGETTSANTDYSSISLPYAVQAPTVGATYVFTIDGQSSTGTCTWGGSVATAASLRVQLVTQGG